MKLLFLDFDGVLHPNFCDPKDYFNRADHLMEVLEACPGKADIVVSSSWRFHYTYKELVSFLPEPLRLLVKAVTPQVEPGPHQRYREIIGYLDRNVGTRDWRAIDDDLSEFPKDCSELIVCDGRVGLNLKSATLLRQWLDSNS